MKALLLGVLVVLLRISQEVAPTWVTSPFVKADWKKIISTKTGNTSTPTGSLTFSAPAFTAIPNLGYGISNYDGTIYSLAQVTTPCIPKCSKSIGRDSRQAHSV